LVTQRNLLFGITSKGDAQGVEPGPGTGRASFAQTFTAIAGFSKHAGRSGAGRVIPAPVDEDGFENIIAGDEERFKRGRNGDNLMTPFQCDKCHFVNMQKRNPSLTCEKDRYLMKLIRRANLDACWAREPLKAAAK
jgi:hypothetical protein